MRTHLIRIGNSTGIVLPKVLLKQLKMNESDTVDMAVKEGTLMLTPVKELRKGWEENLVRAIEIHGNIAEDELMEFPNEFDDKEWTW